nr:MAG TPA: hypothetical protein [Caudoviricetes sp.]
MIFIYYCFYLLKNFIFVVYCYITTMQIYIIFDNVDHK